MRSSKRDRWFRDPCEASNRGPPLTNWKPPSEWLAYLRSGKPRRSFAARLPRDKGSAAVGYPGRSGRETKATGSHAATDMISRLVLRRAKPKHTAATSAAKPEKKNPPPGAPPEPAGGQRGQRAEVNRWGAEAAPELLGNVWPRPTGGPGGRPRRALKSEGYRKRLSQARRSRDVGRRSVLRRVTVPETPRVTVWRTERRARRRHRVGRWRHRVGRWRHRVGRWRHRVGRWRHRLGRWRHRLGRWRHRLGRWRHRCLGRSSEPDVRSERGCRRWRHRVRRRRTVAVADDSSGVWRDGSSVASVTVSVCPPRRPVKCVSSSARLGAAKTSASANEAAKSASPRGR